MSDDYSGFIDISNGPAPADSSTSFMDAPKRVGADIANTAASVATAAQFGAEQAGDPNLAHFLRGLSMLGHEAGDYLGNSISEGGKRDEGASLIPGEGEASVYKHPLGAAWMKGAGLVVPIAIGSLGELAGGLAGTIAAGGGTQLAQGIDNAIAWTNNLDDEQLAKQSPVFQKYLEQSGGDADRARAMLHADQYSYKQALADTATGAATYGAAGAALKGAGAGAGNSLVNAALGVGEVAGAVGASAGVQNYGQQWGQLAATHPDQDVDWNQVAHATVNGGLEGMLLGAAGEGAKHAFGDRANKSVGAIPDSDVGNTPHTVSGGFTSGVAPQPVGAHTRAPETPVEYPKEGVTPAGNTRTGSVPVQTDAVPADVQAAIGNTATPKAQEPAPVAPPVGQATPLPLEAQQAMERQQAQPQPAPVAAPPATPAPVAAPPATPEAPAPPLDTGQNVPEAPKTLAIQQQAAADGKHPAVMYPTGTTPLPRPKGWQTFKNDRGVIHYDPKQLKWKDISDASKAGKENEILGLGPVSKPEVDTRVTQGEQPVGVVERTPDGTEVKAAAGTTETAPTQVRALEATKTEPENTVQVESPDKVLADRVMQKHAGEILSPTEAKTEPKAGRVLEDVRPEAKANAEADAETAREIQARNEASIKEATDTAAKQEAGPQAGHATKEKKAERAASNEAASAVVAAHPPADAELTYEGNGKGKVMSVVARAARKAIIERAKAMVAAADKALLPIRENFRTNIDPTLNHNAAMELLKQAARLAGKKEPRTADFADFVTKDKAVRGDQTPEGQAKAKELLAADRKEGGEEAKKVKQKEGASEPSEKDVAEHAFQAAEAATGKEVRPIGLEQVKAARIKAELERRAKVELEARAKEALPPGEGGVVGVDKAGKFKVEARRKIVKPGVGPKGEAIKKVAFARESINREPTDAQKEAGNYAKGHVTFEGMPVSLENPKGGTRTGTDAKGKPWETKLPADYGYIKGTMGADGDHVDTYIGPRGETGKVFVVNQIDLKTGKFDEHKVIMGVNSKEEAQRLYERGFSDGKGADRIGSIVETNPQDLKEWLAKGERTEPMSPTHAGELDELSDKPQTVTYLGKDVETLHSSTVSEALGKLNIPSHGIMGHILPMLRKRLSALTGDTPMHFLSEDSMRKLFPDSPLGVYDPIGHQIFVSEKGLGSGERSSHVMMHEAIHAAVWHALERDPLMKQVIGRLAKEVRDFSQPLDELTGDNINDHYGMGAGGPVDPHEFLSEALTNAEFQGKLAQVEVSYDLVRQLQLTTPRPTAWDGVISMVRKLLGMPPHSMTVLDAAIRVTERLASKNDAARSRFNDELGRNTPANPAYLPSVTEAGKKAFEFVRDRVSGDDKTLRWGSKLLTNDQLRQSTRKMVGDEFNQEHTKLNDNIERMGVRQREYREEGLDYVKKEATLSRKYEGTPAWDKYMEVREGGTQYNVHPDKALDSASNRHLDVSKDTRDKLAAGKDAEYAGAMNVWQARAKHGELSRAYGALPDDLKSLYQTGKGYYAERQGQLARATVEDILHGVDAPGVDKAKLADRVLGAQLTDEDKALFEKPVADALSKAKELQTSKGPYFPAMRHGDYVVNAKHVVDTPANARRLNAEGLPDPKGDVFEFSGKDARQQAHKFHTGLDLPASTDTAYYDTLTGKKTTKEGGLSQSGEPEQRYQTTVQRQHTEFFKSKREATARREELAASKHLEDVRDVDLRKQNPNVDYELSSPQVRALVDAVRKSGRTDQEKATLERTLLESSLSMRQGTRVEHRRLPRRNVQGASRDVTRNAIDYNNSVSAYLSRHDFKKEVDQNLNTMRDITDAGKYSGQSLDRRTVLQEMENRLYGFGSPEYTGRMAPFWQHAMTLSFLKRMASPAHLLLHMTHPTMISGPVLGARHGFPQAYSALVRAYKDMGAGGALGEGFKGAKRVWGDDTAHPTNFTNLFKQNLKGAKDGGAVSRMLDELTATGHIHPDAGFEVSRLDSQGNAASRGLARVDSAFRELTGATESINRVAEAIAAYRLEASKGADHDKATQYAKQTLANTQGLYSATNAAPVFRDPRMRPFLQFKQFPQMIYHLLGKNLYDAFKGETKEVRTEAARAFAGVVGTHVAMAGALGLPMELAKIPVMLANALGVTNTNWSDLEEGAQEGAAKVFGPQLGEIVMHGLSRAMGPLSVDVHHRLGLNSLLTFGEPKSGKSDDVMKWIYDTIGGAPASMLADTIDATNALHNGEYMKAAEKLVPAKAIDDLLKAARLTSEGKPSKQGVGMRPLNVGEAFMQAAGFTPASVSQYNEARYAAGKSMRGEATDKTSLVTRWVNATGAEKAKAMIDVSKWNRAHDEDNQITASTLRAAATRQKDTKEENGLGYGITDKNRGTITKYENLYNVH